MKIGYPCVNRGIGCTPSTTFRLKSYSTERFVRTVTENLRCLRETLRFNLSNNLLFFRLSSDLVPFASHPVNTFEWQDYFRNDFREVGRFVRQHGMRISMHPDQFTLINSPDNALFERSVRELQYHTDILELMELDRTARIQIHIGGVYGDKPAGIKRFISRWKTLGQGLRERLAIENDDVRYTLSDCLAVHEATGIPVIFDTLHHEVNNAGERPPDAASAAFRTWQKADGVPMVDYSDQKKGARRGAHRDTIDTEAFSSFLEETEPWDFDIMLEIKDKEASALKAVKLVSDDLRFVRAEQQVV